EAAGRGDREAAAVKPRIANVDAMQHVDRRHEVWRLRVAAGIHRNRSSTISEGQGRSRAQSENARGLPSTENRRADSLVKEVLSLVEWRAIHVALHEVERAVEIGARVVALGVDVPAGQTAVVAGLIVHRLLPGEGGRHGETGGPAAIEFHLQRMEARREALVILRLGNGASEFDVVRLSRVA